MNKSIIALIPARAGSKRIKDKNIRKIGGHPLLAYTICAARDSGIFKSVMVSTDSREYAEIARHYGAEVPFLRPKSLAGSLSPDIEWVEFTLNKLKDAGRVFDCFSILRPTSPFRQSGTIRRAWRRFCSDSSVDSLRAVEKCKQHPGKMWIVKGNRMKPLLKGPVKQPWHSSQYQALPLVYVQNASLEIAWTSIVSKTYTIAGEIIMPFFTEGYEGFDVNHPYDWKLAEELIENGDVKLPVVKVKPYKQ